MSAPKFDRKTLEEILKKTRKDIGWVAWKSKTSVIFSLRAKYGDSIDKDEAVKIYDQMRKDEDGS